MNSVLRAWCGRVVEYRLYREIRRGGGRTTGGITGSGTGVPRKVLQAVYSRTGRQGMNQ